MNIDRARAFFDRSVFRPDIPQQPRCFTVGYLNGDGLEKGEYSLCGAAAADEVSGVTPVTALHSFLPTLTSLLPPSSSSTRSPQQPPFDSNTWQCTPPGHSHTLTTLVGPPTDPFWRRAQAAVAPAVTVGCRTHVGLNCWIFRLTAEAKGHLSAALRIGTPGDSCSVSSYPVCTPFIPLDATRPFRSATTRNSRMNLRRHCYRLRRCRWWR
ncbi:hypothetical protein FB45DRAFT_1008433 [Roridomyces roridus]|uniref:Uncharacterized protein n=1 Tax=Roridomyces roridus TaxID=1738132 RepID=A0AAD7B1F3_9AGAR|nr:hypothetical protein FB45DRAFT_1011246 [Roridomyces roridus]KAJ7615555.1 hypothetical protein FB45DRAFT_1008433 [Roridomyces roridus]